MNAAIPSPCPTGGLPWRRATISPRGRRRTSTTSGAYLVVWREEASGQPHVVEAYCAHLGAHLGVGAGSPDSHEPGPGTVAGACLQCPFHGWRYDGSGACVEIPYAKSARIPDKARVRGFPAVEMNGLIFAWHHAHGEPPQWELPVLDEFDDPEWVGPVYTDRFIATALARVDGERSGHGALRLRARPRRRARADHEVGRAHAHHRGPT